jgi:hypothetical protein
MSLTGNSGFLSTPRTTRRLKSSVPETPYHDEQEDFDDDMAISLDILAGHIGAPGDILPDGLTLTNDGSLVVTNTSEVYVATDDQLTAVSDEISEVEVEAEVEFGRGKRQKEPNRQYVEFWRH